MTKEEARQQFSAMMQRTDSDIELDRAALLIAAEEYPNLALENYLARLDELAAEVRQQMTPMQIAAPLETVKALAEFLFYEGQFNGNTNSYYDVRNSFLNEVLDRGKGIPITLSVVFIEVARRLGVKLFGVGLPGHFIVKYCDETGETFFDPFNGGRALDEEKCRTIVKDMYNDQLPFDRAFLHAFTKKQILWRMLQNLKGVYFNASDMTKALAVIERLLLINPAAPEEIRDRGLVCLSLKKYSQAQTALTAYLRAMPNAADKDKIKKALNDLRQRQARLN